MSLLSAPFHIITSFTTFVSMCLFLNTNYILLNIYKTKHKFWGTKQIYQITCPPTEPSFIFKLLNVGKGIVMSAWIGHSNNCSASISGLLFCVYREMNRKCLSINEPIVRACVYKILL